LSIFEYFYVYRADGRAYGMSRNVKIAPPHLVAKLARIRWCLSSSCRPYYSLSL